MTSEVHRNGTAREARPISPIGVRLLRRASRLIDRVRDVLGMHRAVVVDDVRYTEIGAEPLRRALSRRGSGSKSFTAAFPGGTTLRITCTNARTYADLCEPRLMPCYALLAPNIRPGMRVLDLGCGTGYGTAWLLDGVGPSGAAVAVDRDQESISYAQLRYGAPNAAFEVGWLDALSGETDGMFDLTVCVGAMGEADDPDAVISELWRLLRPGGWMLVAAPVLTTTHTPRPGESARAFKPEDLSDAVRAVVERSIATRDDAGSHENGVHGTRDEAADDDELPATGDVAPGTPGEPPPRPVASETIVSEPPADAPQADHVAVMVNKPVR